MRLLFLLLFSILSFSSTRAGVVRGKVTDAQGTNLPYASITIKGTTKGVATNNQGRYEIDLDPGEYTLICQYVGYSKQEKKVKIEPGQGQPVVVDFQLSLVVLSETAAVVRPGGEDPAYAIIRHAIKKRKDYQSPLDSFTCEAYIKTLIRTRHLPAQILGQKLQDKDRLQMGVDSEGKGIIYLSESLTHVAFKKPGHFKLEVLSGRESGTNGFGFGVPTFINFYDNNVTVISRDLNPRGFVSPIAESALNFYKYKYLGSFWEDGKEINKIQVIPRRKYEPLFSGTINIVDGEWRIHSLDLLLLRQSQLEVLDTLEIRQIQVPVSSDVWMTKNQDVYFTFNLFGVDGVGNFLNVYNKYELAPRFRKKYFNNVLIRFDTAVNKKTRAYWDSIRPVPLEPDESKDYRIKDSIYAANHDSAGAARNRDSLLKEQGRLNPFKALFAGFSRSDFNPRGAFTYALESPLSHIHYNTVEGINLNLAGTLGKRFGPDGPSLSLSPHIRYGFSNGRLNAWGMLALNKRSLSIQGSGNGEGQGPGPDFSVSRQQWTISGGRRISQFNPDNPISETMNEIYTLLERENYMKIYENVFGELTTTHRLDNGLRIGIRGLYEDRMPLANTTGYSFFQPDHHAFTPNYPVEQLDTPFPRHQAFLTTIDLQYQPGQHYIEFPHAKISMGSSYPTMALTYTKGWKDIFGSDVDFDKWQFSVWEDVNLRLRGLLRYRLSIGGFLNTRSVFIQDYQHFNGNQTIFASQYLNSFQIAPYYANSTTAAFYSTGHIEYHLNGFLTNKIPLFRRLSWWLEGGSNAFYVNPNNNYVEVFGGLENIFKLFRVDFVASYLDGQKGQVGVRLGLGGLLQGAMGQRR